MKVHSGIVICGFNNSYIYSRRCILKRIFKDCSWNRGGGGVCEMPHYLNLRLSRDR